MTDQFGIVYGASLLLGGMLGFFRRGSKVSLLTGVIFGAWSIYNSTHPSRQNTAANFAIGTGLGIFMLVRFFKSRKVFPALVVASLSCIQAFRNYPYLKQ